MIRSSRATLFFSRQLSETPWILMLLVSTIVLMASVCPAVGQVPKKVAQITPPQTCKAPTLELSVGNDEQVLEHYRQGVAKLLQQGRFEELDCLADMARSSKARLPGGVWQLRELYRGVTELKGHLTDPDWQSHLEHVQKWMAARPQSITARVALATVYVDYAWAARGTGWSDGVTDNGWRLMRQRLSLAKSILDQASALPAKCPQWYSVMQDVALGQGWDQAQATELLRKAVTFAPDYYYYYRSHAYYLLPKWNGEDGDAARFAAESADHVGGDAGDILYFQIGTDVICTCDEPEFGRMSWARLQKGYALLEKKYGVSIAQLNFLALMAAKSDDSVVADEAFKRVGDNWIEDTWMTEDYFKQIKAWAAEMAPAEARSRKILQEAETGLSTPEGKRYQKQFEQALLPLVRQCPASGNDGPTQFELVVQVGKDGGLDNAWPRQLTRLAQCVMHQLSVAHAKGQTPFPPPPHPAYWLKVQVGPAAPHIAEN
jgi:hypothetical protein